VARRGNRQQLAIVEPPELNALGRTAWPKVAQPEAIEHLHRVGTHPDASADFAQRRRLFSDANAVPLPRQSGRRGQAAETRADDDDVQAAHRGQLPRLCALIRRPSERRRADQHELLRAAVRGRHARVSNAPHLG
jgi:hypothetical protein